jgi:dihydrofolate reductase
LTPSVGRRQPNSGLSKNVVTNQRKIIVHIATSADGYIARPDGDIEWLTKRPAPKGFYGISKFINSIDTKLLGRKTYDLSVQMGATFDTQTPHYVFSRRPAPASVPPGVEFITEAIGAFAKRLRTAKGKDIWMMGGGEIMASFLDEGAIDDFIISVVPTFIGEGIPLIARRHRHVPLNLRSVRRFPDGVVQVHYKVQQTAG